MPSSKPLYGILGVYLPLSVLILWARLCSWAFFQLIYLPFNQIWHTFGVSVDEWFWCSAGFLGALGASLYAGMIKKSRPRHIAADFRGSIVLAIAVYALMSLLRRNLPLPERFLPSGGTVCAALAAVFCWFSAIFLRDVFAGLELFEHYKAQYRGERLREVMRELSPEMSKTDRELGSLIKSYGVQFILPCLILGALGPFQNSPSFWVLVFLIFIAGFFILGFLRLLRRELKFAAEGISLTIRDRALPAPVMALGIGTAALLALGASSDLSLLPPEIIFGFLGRLGRLLASLARPREQADFSLPEQLFKQGGVERLSGLLPPAEETGPWPGWKWLKYGFIALLAFLFLLFMVYPLLKRSGFSLNPRKIRAAFGSWFGNLKRGIRSFFGAFLERGASQRLKKADAEKLRRIVETLFPGTFKTKEIKRSVNLFARLIVWGVDTAGVPWKPSHAPGEYCGLLAAALGPAETASGALPGTTAGRVPLSERVIRSAELFEKALYSARPLSAAEEKEFKLLVEGIIGEDLAG